MSKLARARHPEKAVRPVSSLPHRVAAIILPGLLAAVPLAIAPGLAIYHDVDTKAVVLTFAVAVLLLTAPWRMPEVRSFISGREGRILAVLLAAQLLSAGIATAFSANPLLSLAGSNWRRLGLLVEAAVIAYALLLAAWAAVGGSRLIVALRVATASGAAAASYGILQYFGIDPLLPADLYTIGDENAAIVRTPGTLGHAGYFATYLVHIVYISIAVAGTDRDLRWRRVGGIAAVLSAIAIVFSGTRGALVGLAAGAAVAAFWYGIKVNKRTVAAALAVVAAGVVFYFSPAGDRLRVRTQWAIEDATGGGRLLLWRDASRMGLANLFTGAGPETFSSQFPAHQSTELARAYPNRYYESAHNALVDTFASQGLSSLLALLATTLCGVWAARQATRHGDARAGWMLAALLGALGANQFVSFTIPTALYFYANAALLFALVPVIGGEEKTRQRRLLTCIVSVPLAAILLNYSGRLAFSNLYLVDAERFARSGEIPDALSAYEKYRAARPAGASMDLWFSRLVLERLGGVTDPSSRQTCFRAGLNAAVRATENAEDRHNAHYNLAIYRAAGDDFAGTEASLRAVISAAPQWYKPYWMLAKLLASAGRIAEAETLATKAAELNNGADSEVAESYEQIRTLARSSSIGSE